MLYYKAQALYSDQVENSKHIVGAATLDTAFAANGGRLAVSSIGLLLIILVNLLALGLLIIA